MSEREVFKANAANPAEGKYNFDSKERKRKPHE